MRRLALCLVIPMFYSAYYLIMNMQQDPEVLERLHHETSYNYTTVCRSVHGKTSTTRGSAIPACPWCVRSRLKGNLCGPYSPRYYCRI